MAKRNWHVAAELLPQDRQEVICIVPSGTKPNDFNMFLAKYTNKQFRVCIGGQNYFAHDNSLAISFECQMTLTNVVLWIEKEILTDSASIALAELNNH